MKTGFRKTLYLLFLFSGLFNAFASSPARAEEASLAGEEETFQGSLESIAECLEQNRLELLHDLITIDFLNGITNSVFRVTALSYIGEWINNYGNEFSEAFLLYCMAGGEMQPLAERYDNLDNIVSKNCIRWCLMVRGVELLSGEGKITSKQGTFFGFDEKRWYCTPAILYMQDNAIFKPFIVKRRGMLPKLQQFAGGGTVVVRNDQVPVPWGNGMYPDINSYPYLVPKSWLKPPSNYKTGIWNRRQFPVTWNSMVSSFGSGSESVYTDDLHPNTGNRTWDFFVKLNSPFLFLGGQVIARQSSSIISGQFHSFSRILVSHKLNKRNFMDDSVQDLVVSPPVFFKLAPEADGPRAAFTYPGVSIVKQTKLNLSRKELLDLGESDEWKKEGMVEVNRLLHRRSKYKAFALVCFAVSLIWIWIVQRGKKKGAKDPGQCK